MVAANLNSRLCSPADIRSRWPFMTLEEAADIQGRVDRLYRLLVIHQVPRGEAAVQVHRFINEPSR